MKPVWGRIRSIFREYDIRGIAGVDYDEDFVEALGRASAPSCARSGIGRMRRSAATAALTQPGLPQGAQGGAAFDRRRRVDVGMCPTPLLYFAVHHLDLLAGIQVTGSHNPPDHNGFKIVRRQDRRSTATTSTSCAASSSKRAVRARRRRRGSVPDHARLSGLHGRAVRARWRGLKVVVDSRQRHRRVRSRPAIYRAMGCEVIELYSEPDGAFPTTTPTRPSRRTSRI